MPQEKNAERRPAGKSAAKPAKGGSKLIWIVGGIVAGVLVLCVAPGLIIGGVYYLWSRVPQIDTIKLVDKAGNQIEIPIPQKDANPAQDRNIAYRAKLNTTSFEVRNAHFAGKAPHVVLLHIMPLRLDQGGKPPDPKEQRFELWDLKAEKLLAQAPFGPAGLRNEDIQDLSPEGNYVVNNEGFQKHKVSIYAMKTRNYTSSDWELTYTRKNDKVQARWVKFVDEQRVLAVYDDGAADLWTVANRARMPLLPAITNERGERDGRLSPRDMPGSRRLQNYGLSPDGRLFAQWNHTGFNLADTQTGKLRHKLTVKGDVKDIHRPEGVAFDPSGKFMAAVVRFEYRQPGTPEKNESVVCRWDVGTGQLVQQIPLRIPNYNSGHHHLGWWGTKHYFVSMGSEGHILDSETAEYLGKSTMDGSGAKLLDLGSDGNVNYLVEPAVFNKAHFIAATPPVADLRPQMPVLKFTINGPQLMP